jgi:hypothetical protein
LTRGWKVLLAALTVWPLFYFFGFTVWVVAILAWGDRDSVGDEWDVLLPLHVATMLLTVGLTVVYVLHVFRSGRVREDQRLLWAAIIFVGNVLAMPFYWYLYVWREPARADGADSPAEIE